MRVQDKDRWFTELARRLNMDREVMMRMPIVEVARLMGERGVKMGLAVVT